MDAFVTGGSRFVGRHLLRRLTDRGDTVRALARSDPSATTVRELDAEPVEDGRFAWIDRGRYPVATGHVENVVAARLLAAEADDVGGEASYVTDGEPVQFRTFLTDLLAARGLTPGDRSVPRPLAKVLARGGDWLWRRLGLSASPPFTRSYVYLFGLPMTIDDTKARRELGYEPTVTRSAGLAALQDDG